MHVAAISDFSKILYAWAVINTEMQSVQTSTRYTQLYTKMHDLKNFFALRIFKVIAEIVQNLNNVKVFEQISHTVVSTDTHTEFNNHF